MPDNDTVVSNGNSPVDPNDGSVHAEDAVQGGTITTDATAPQPNATAGIQNQPVAPQAQQDVQDFGNNKPDVLHGFDAKAQQAQQQAQTTQKAPPQVTQKASWLHDIAQTLAGGPQYKYSIDPNTGTMEKTPVPVSGKHLAMAIALEAIGGASTGLAAGKGAGNMGKGAAAAFQQGEQRAQQQTAQAKKQASDDFARQASISQTNMRMAMNQRALSQADEQMHDQYVKNYSPLYNLANQAGGIDQTVHGSDALHKLLQSGTLNVTEHNAIPIRYFPVQDAQGNPVKGDNGEQKWDYDYAVIKPGTQVTLPPEMKDILTKYKIPGYVDRDGKAVDLPDDWEQRFHLVIDGMEKAQTLINDEQVAKGLRDKLSNPMDSKSEPIKPSDTTAPKSLPVIKDENVAGLVDSAATKYGIDPSIARALVLEESGGKQTAVSKKGAVGLGQLMPATAKQYNVDPTNAEQNIDGSMHYLSDLVKKNGGDVSKALAQYHGIGSDGITTDQQYVQKIMNTAGPQDEPSGKANSKAQLSDEQITSMLQGLSPKQRELFSQWKMFYDGTPNKASTMEELTKPGPNGQPPRYAPEDVGAVRNVFDKIYPVTQYYQDTQDALDQRKLDLADNKAQDKADREMELSKQSQQWLTYPPQFKPVDGIMNMNPQDANKALTAQGVKVPPEIGALQAVAKYGANLERSFPAKVYKGTATISAQDAISYIKQFINPNFDETKYAAAKKFREDLTPGGSVGKAMISVGQASNHLELAMKALDNLDNSKWPGWNEVANSFATQAGQPAPKTYTAIAHTLAHEVGKVISGSGAVHQADLDDLNKQLSTADSPETAKSVLNAYIGLMNARISEVNDQKKDYFGEELHVSPETATVFGSRGNHVPGYGDPVYSPDGHIAGLSNDGGKTYSLQFKGQFSPGKNKWE